ncbi:MAG: hypothetical protein JXB29_04285 [Sedimentisphaerales bacterium]|nr:hypothetical protein [Sedimentisphaerales bacterium]
MSNRVDFFQADRTQLAYPAATVSILLDGMLCPPLELKEIVRAGWPEFSWARFVYNTAAYPDGQVVAAEEIEKEVGIGKPISVHQYYNGTAPGVSAFSLAIFAGQIEGIDRKYGANGESVEVIAKDFSSSLKRIVVYGQRVGNSVGSGLFLAGVDTIFNEEGQGNAAAEPVQYNGDTYTVFSAEPTGGRLWKCAEVINYLLCEHLPAGQLQVPDIEQLGVFTEDLTLRDFDVMGLNLLESLQQCCERASLRFKFVPRLASTGPSQAIVFYKDDTGRAIELNRQRAGEQVSISRTNVAAVQGSKSFQPVTHKYIGQGDFRVYEATFELIKAWDSSLEDTDYDKFSPSTNSSFYQVKDVYRKWCLNEAGDYTGSPFNQGDAFDFSKVFESSNFAQRRRRFLPALSADKQGKSLGYFLEVSFDDGANWWQYLYAFNNLLEECGIWLSSDRPDVDSWVAALKGVLKFRITASVVSDERLSCAVADGPVDSAAPVVEHIITLPRQFKYRNVSGQSVFANSSDDSIGTPDEIDDTEALYEFIRKRAGLRSNVIESFDVKTAYLAFDCQLGDTVTSDVDVDVRQAVRSGTDFG